MNNSNWNNKIKNNFNKAAENYNNFSYVQKHFCKEISCFVEDLNIPKGEWFDLGSGTGFLADEIEKKFPEKNIIRIDFCENMLSANKINSKRMLWDLNIGLPPLETKASLVVSNFCVHWLNNPNEVLKSWFDFLTPGGFLIISFPTNKSFPEWKGTCIKHNIRYSGITFPEIDLLKFESSKNDRSLINCFSYVETFPNVIKLFRNIKNIGAQSTKSKKMTIKELKTIQKLWPRNTNHSINLTWDINILILQK